MFAPLTGKIYALGYFQLSMIVYCDALNNVLWLDHHSNDEDFAQFANQEKLIELNIDKRDLVRLIVATKFNFLGRPKAVFEIGDIPFFPARLRQVIQENPESYRLLLQDEQRLTDLSAEIHDLIYQKQTGRLELDFMV